MSTRPLSTRVDEPRPGRPVHTEARPGPRLPSIERVRRSAAAVEAARERLDGARDELAAAIRAALETGYSLRMIARAAGLSHEAVRRYRWRQ